MPIVETIIITITAGAVVLKMLGDREVIVEPPPHPTPEVGVGTAFQRAPGYLQTLIMQAWPQREWNNAALISECESRWNPLAHNTSGEDSRGLFQINIGPGANTDMAEWTLFDPVVNVKAARQVWGYRNNWTAWLNCARITGVIP